MGLNNKFSAIVLMCFMMSPVISLAGDASGDPCQLSDVIRIQRPVHPGDPKSPTFKYAFRFIQEGDPNLPVIIFMPGGPGEASIKAGGSKHPGFNYIETDPRGVGCNTDMGAVVDPSAFSTANLASDILALIKSLKLKKYILHGHSYGTVLATQVAARAGHSKAIPAPTAVVLTGTLGHAFSAESVYKGSQEQWGLIKRGLPKDVLDQLSRPELPFGFDADQWGRAIVMLMSTSASVNPIFDVGNFLLSLQTKDPDKLAQLKEIVSFDFSTEQPDYTRLNRPVWCRELSQTDNTDLALIGGELVGNRTPDFCKGFSTAIPYDSKDWQITAPIFYFQGAKDNLTTLEQAKYHYAQQKKTKRFFVGLPEDSHIFAVCPNNSDALWKSIAQQGQGYEEVMSHCSGSPQLEVSEANQ